VPAAEPVTIVGSYLSPYVRKVLAVLGLKGIPYRIDPIIPFFGNDEFSRLSPVRRIPVLLDDCVTLCDSTVICEYLEERHPEPALLPPDLAQRARARWLEEFADTRMGEVLIWRLFNQVVINRFVWGGDTDQAVLARARSEEIPRILDYLEAELPPAGYLFGALSRADLSIATFFRNASFARYAVDAGRWPRTAAFVDRVLALDCFAALAPFEELLLRTPIPQHREALARAGAPLTAGTYGTDAPRRGILST
jgi:glutathione S-transferase